MAVSQNGWPAIKSSTDSRLTNFPPVTGRVYHDDVEVVFHWLVREYEKHVEEIKRPWSWAWAYRAIRGYLTVSNHASGTALDFNAPRHPLGVAPSRTMTSAQIASCRRIASRSGGVLRWGGDYAGRKDTMHWEINANRAAVSRLADQIRAEGTVPVGRPTPKPNPKPKTPWVWKGVSEQKTRDIQRALRGHGIYKGDITGRYDNLTRAAVREYQRDANRFGGANFSCDGLWGPVTQAWYFWVKALQNAIAKINASQKLGRMLADGHYGPLTNRHVKAVMEANRKWYSRAGGVIADGEAGPIFIKMLNAKPFSFDSLKPFKW